MSYYLAQSLKDLRSEVDAAHPGRDKASDGWIGDASHSARPSDHNPDWSDGGVVRAIDIDVSNIDVNKLMGILKKDSRVNYFIYNRSIYGASKFAKRAYNGTNPHVKHIHVSIKHSKAAERGGAWGYSKGAVKPVGSKPKPAKDKSGSWPEKPLRVTSKHTVQSDAAWRELMSAIGYKDKDLGKNLQTWLSKLEDPRTGKGYYDTDKWLIDGDFSTESVKALQRKLYDTKDDNGKRLYNGKADGDRGPLTVKAEIGYLNLKANRGA